MSEIAPAQEDVQPAINELVTANAVKFTYTPSVLSRDMLRQLERMLVVVFRALIIPALIGAFLCQGNIWLFLVPLGGLLGILLGVLVGLLIFAACKLVRQRRQTGMVKIDPAGLWLPASMIGRKTDGGRQTLYPWAALLSAGEGKRSSSRSSPALELIFNAANLSAEAMIVGRCWGQRKNDRQKIEIDLRAAPRRDHERIIKAIKRFAPPDRISAEIGKLIAVRRDVNFTQLWMESLRAEPERLSARQLGAGAWVSDYRFEIIRCIAAGGQGTAYEAIDHLADTASGASQRVVLKEFILPVHAEFDIACESARAVEREAAIMRQVACDSIAELYDVFVEDHRAYLVLEYVDGKSLRELVEENGPLEPGLACQLSIQMCEILKHLHEQKPPIIHCDFTPENLLVTADGQVKLIDFDAAHQLEDAASTRVVGKPNYLPPEQFRGQASTQSDIYSLGATLYFTLTGAQPTPISQLHPRSRRDSLKARLDDIVSKATMLDVTDRYATVEDLKRELELFLDKQP